MGVVSLIDWRGFICKFSKLNFLTCNVILESCFNKGCLPHRISDTNYPLRHQSEEGLLVILVQTHIILSSLQATIPGLNRSPTIVSSPSRNWSKRIIGMWQYKPQISKLKYATVHTSPQLQIRLDLQQLFLTVITMLIACVAVEHTKNFDMVELWMCVGNFVLHSSIVRKAKQTGFRHNSWRAVYDRYYLSNRLRFIMLNWQRSFQAS